MVHFFQFLKYESSDAVASWKLGVIALLVFGGCKGNIQKPETNPTWPERPNIVWLVAEDMGPFIPPFGDSTIATPNLSRLASDGVRYTRVYSPSGVCAPSRAAIATGMYPTAIGAQHMRTGPWWRGRPAPEVIESAAQYMPKGIVPYEALPPKQVKMHSEYLREQGYYTTNNPKEDYQFVKPVTAWDESSDEAHWRNENREPGQPFFSVFNFNVTHESQIWAKAEDSLLVADTLAVPVPPYLPDTRVVRDDLRRMYSNIIEMDAQVGALLDQLESDGLLEETIIFWYTDHGGPMPRQKRAIYDSGLQVPMIVRFPNGWRAGQSDDQMISFIDFLPTLLSITGQKPPEYLHGRAFLGAYAGEERDYIHAASDRFDSHYDTKRAVRDHRFKYIKNFQPDKGYYLPLAYREQMPTMKEMLRLRIAGKLDSLEALWFRQQKPEEELFDTQNDPHELYNLAGDSAYADKLKELRAEYKRWAETVPDYGLMPEKSYLDLIWPESKQPISKMPAASWNDGRLELESETKGASIGYQIVDKGSQTGSAWQIYEKPFVVEKGKQVIAVAHRIGYLPSDTVSFGKQIQD